MKHYLMEPIFFTPPRDKLNRQLYKSGGDAPSPDPQIGQAALKNAQVGQDAFDFFKQEYINAKPAQDKLNALAAEVQQQLAESGKLNNEYSKEYYNYMTDVFRPLEKSIVDNANNYDTAGRREQEAALGLADVTQTFDAQRAKTNRSNERMGINPNSGNAQAVNAQIDVAEAVAGANAMNKGRKNAETMGNAMKMDAASLGRNLPSNQATSQQIANSSATGAVNTGLSTMANDRAQTGLMQSGFTNAMQGYNNQATILTNQYQAESQAYNQQQANNAQGWAGLGTLAGLAIQRFSDGGEVSEEAYALEGQGAPMDAVFEGTGKVSGPGTTTSDSIPARLSNGEFVLNAEATKMIGLDTLNAINKKGLETRKGAKQ